MRFPLWCIGHRGAAGHAPENTLSCFARGLALGASWVELDVRRVENELVVFHDSRLERMTNGTGRVEGRSLAEIRQLEVRGGEKIPLLQEVFDLVACRAGLVIELKGNRTAELVAFAIEHNVGQGGWRYDDFLVCSFDHQELKRFKQLCPVVPVGPLIYGLPFDYAAAGEALGAFSIHATVEFINSEFIADAQRRGLKVVVYTVNDADDIQRMRGLGVDGLITDYPERVRMESKPE